MNKGGIPEGNGELKIRANFKKTFCSSKKDSRMESHAKLHSLVVTEPQNMDMLERDLVIAVICV